jgi:hypothetical protein
MAISIMHSSIFVICCGGIAPRLPRIPNPKAFNANDYRYSEEERKPRVMLTLSHTLIRPKHLKPPSNISPLISSEEYGYD